MTLEKYCILHNPLDLDGTTASLACAANASPAALLGDTGSCAEQVEAKGYITEHMWNIFTVDGYDLVCFFLIVKYPKDSVFTHCCETLSNIYIYRLW